MQQVKGQRDTQIERIKAGKDRGKVEKEGRCWSGGLRYEEGAAETYFNASPAILLSLLLSR